MREEIYNLKRAIEAEQLIKETREAEIRSYERKAKRGRKQSNQITPRSSEQEGIKRKANSSFMSIDTQNEGFNIPDDMSSEEEQLDSDGDENMLMETGRSIR